MVDKKIIDGAKAGGAGIAGSLVLGPTLGPVAGGFAARQFVGGDTPWLQAGVAMGLASWLSGGGGGSSGSRMARNSVSNRGWK